MAKRRPVPTRYYDPAKIVDAPEHYAYSNAMGILARGTWDHSVRPIEQRFHDFVSTFPPEDPVQFSAGGSLHRGADGALEPGTQETRLQRFLARDWRMGSLHELLARYGLRLSDGPAPRERPFQPESMHEAGRRRNKRLRTLHGRVDIEASDMNAAKAEFLEQQDRKKAAQEIKDAVSQMLEDLDRSGAGS